MQVSSGLSENEPAPCGAHGSCLDAASGLWPVSGQEGCAPLTVATLSASAPSITAGTAVARVTA